MTVHEEWRWTDERGVQRQVGTEELRAALANSVLPPSTLVWRKGMAEWAPASSMPELASAAHAVTAPTTLPKEVRAQRPADVGRPQRPRASVPPPRGQFATLVGIPGRDEAATKGSAAAPIVVPSAPTAGSAPGGAASGGGEAVAPGEGGPEGSRGSITQIPKYGSPDVDIAAASQEIPKAPRLPDPLIARPRPRRLSTNDVDGFWAAPAADRIVVEGSSGEALDLPLDLEGLAVPEASAAADVQPLKPFGAPLPGSTKLSSRPLPSTQPEGARARSGAVPVEASSASAPLEPFNLTGAPIALAGDAAAVAAREQATVREPAVFPRDKDAGSLEPSTLPTREHAAREQVTVREPAMVPRDKDAGSPEPSTLPTRGQAAREQATVREPAMVPRDPGAAAREGTRGTGKASVAASAESAPASRRDREVASSRSGAPISSRPLSQRPPPPPPQPVRPGRQPSAGSPQRARPVTEGAVKEAIAHLPPPPPLPRDTAASDQKSDLTRSGLAPVPAQLASSAQQARSPALQSYSATQTTPTKPSRSSDEDPTLFIPGTREVRRNGGEAGNQVAAMQAPGASPPPARPSESPGGIEGAADNARSQFASRPPPRPPRLSRPPPLSLEPQAPQPAVATTSPKATSVAEGAASASMSALSREPLSSRTDISPRPDLGSTRAAPAGAVASPSVVAGGGAGAVTGPMARVEPAAVAPEDASLVTVSPISLFTGGLVVAAMLVGAFFVGRASLKARPIIAQPSLYAVPALARAVVPEPLKPCWVARQAVMWAPMASRSIPFDVVATAQGSLAVGYARLGDEAAGLEVTPSTGEVHPRFAQSVSGTIERVVPMPNAEFRVVSTESAGGLSAAVPVPAATPFFVGVRDGALATADRLDGAASRLWPVSDTEGVATARVQIAGDQGYAVTLRREKAIWSGWLGPDRAPRGELSKVVSSGGAVGRPNSGWNRRELAVVFADRPEGAEHWEIRVGRAPTGSVPTSTTVVPLPKGGPGGDAFAPDIAGLPDGRWVLVWTEGPPGSRAIRAQTLSPDLKPIGDPIALSPPAGNFGQGVLGVVDSYAGVIFLSKGASSYELWGAILQCG